MNDQSLSGMQVSADRVEGLCAVMHVAYEKAASSSGWETNPLSRVEWKDVPSANKEAMRHAVRALLLHLACTE